jgi:hypothetical protein
VISQEQIAAWNCGTSSPNAIMTSGQSVAEGKAQVREKPIRQKLSKLQPFKIKKFRRCLNISTLARPKVISLIK